MSELTPADPPREPERSSRLDRVEALMAIAQEARAIESEFAGRLTNVRKTELKLAEDLALEVAISFETLDLRRLELTGWVEKSVPRVLRPPRTTKVLTSRAHAIVCARSDLHLEGNAFGAVVLLDQDGVLWPARLTMTGSHLWDARERAVRGGLGDVVLAPPRSTERDMRHRLLENPKDALDALNWRLVGSDDEDELPDGTVGPAVRGERPLEVTDAEVLGLEPHHVIDALQMVLARRLSALGVQQEDLIARERRT